MRLSAVRRIPDDLWTEIAPILGREKKPDLLDRAFGSAPNLKLEDMLAERRLDEQRTKRKYNI